MSAFLRELNITKLEGIESFDTWSVDIRAILRLEKLWIFATSSKNTLNDPEARREYDGKSVQAADIITLTLSDDVKRKLSRDNFDNGYQMLRQLRDLYQPSGDANDPGEVKKHEAVRTSGISSNRILDLPAELRNVIYELVLPRDQLRYLAIDTNSATKEPSLLHTCKQIRNEASPVFYFNNRFYVNIDLDQKNKEILLCVQRFQAIIERCGAKPFQSCEMRLRGTIWNRVQEFLPLLEFMRLTGFEPAARVHNPPASRKKLATGTPVFHMPARHMVGAQFVLEKAICLACRAHSEGWDTDRLALRYKEYIIEQLRPSRRGTKAKILIEGKPL